MSTKSKRKKSNTTATSDGRKVVATNRRAFHDFQIEEIFEAGIELTGTEIKSIREGRVNLREAYGFIEDGQVWLIGMHISPYHQAGDYFQHDPTRPRRLLLHKSQIADLAFRVEAKGYTLVPIRLVFNRGWAKVDIALARGKQKHDKRQAIAERDAKRAIERALRERY